MSVVNLAVSALEAAPVVAQGLISVASAAQTSIAQHKTIGETAVTTLNATLATLQNPSITSAMGHNDAANVVEGVSIVTQAESLASNISSIVSEIEAFFKKL